MTALRALWRFARRIQLSHDLRLWKITIREEEARHAAYDERMRRMRLEIARLQGELDRLTGRAKVDYQHGPTMRRGAQWTD